MQIIIKMILDFTGLGTLNLFTQLSDIKLSNQVIGMKILVRTCMLVKEVGFTQKY